MSRSERGPVAEGTGDGRGVRVVLVEYYVAERETLVFGMFADRAEPDLRGVAVSRSDLAEIETAVRDALTSGRPELASVLADPRLARLAEPIADWAAPEDLVYLVPHGPLHGLPLYAAPVAGGPLLARNPVAVTPSAAVLRYCLAKRTGRRDSAIIVADPPAGRPLTLARKQATAVAAGVGEARTLVGPDATRSALLAALAEAGGTAGILHFAAHGIFEPDAPMRSGIELADGRLTAEDVLGLTFDVDLVTLGACETGVSGRLPGDELLGLVRAFLYAGAPSALVTLWRVDELSASLLLGDFYAGLAAGAPKAEALRRAQLRLAGRGLAEVLEHTGAMREQARDDHAAFATLSWALARLTARAGDPDAASRILLDAIETPGMSPEDLGLLRVTRKRVMLAGPVRESAPPFADPYHWAPFLLVGDWF